MQNYLPGLLHPAELYRDLGEGGPLVRPVPPALFHQLVAGWGEGGGSRMNKTLDAQMKRGDGSLGNAEYLHLIVTVFRLLHPEALG